MEVNRCRVARKFQRNAVLRLNLEHSGTEAASSGDVHLLRRQRNVIFLRMLDHHGANVIDRTGGVGRLQGVVLDRILKLVIGVAGRNDLDRSSPGR